jgi:hypothetical protein
MKSTNYGDSHYAVLFIITDTEYIVQRVFSYVCMTVMRTETCVVS